MIRALFRLVLLVILVVGIGAVFFGYRWGGHNSDTGVTDRPAATSGTHTIDTTRARQTGAEVGDVGSEDERSRAVALARETKGVTSVVDHLRVTR